MCLCVHFIYVSYHVSFANASYPLSNLSLSFFFKSARPNHYMYQFPFTYIIPLTMDDFLAGEGGLDEKNAKRLLSKDIYSNL